MPVETAQFFTGAAGVLQVCTNTSHPIKLSSNRNVAPTAPSIEISGTGTKAVTISAPLIYKPWVALEMRMSGTTVTIQSSSGYNTITTSNVIRSAAGNYTISFPVHPSSSFIPVVTTRTGTDTGNYYYATCKFTTASATESKLVVYIRNTASTPALVDGDFFFRTAA